ncbi:MAG: hypothetical protein KJ658_05200 [Proteobacteria bacterium]|nr:hypothetical protein [Desulfobacula sp.]MBU3951515.1 hypothetical protein [Pseudomonadota bacterium]
METRCKKGKSNLKINKFKYSADKGKIANKMLKLGIIKEGRIHETADDGIYCFWEAGGRLTRKKEVCFIDTGVNYHVRLPQDCGEYCRECDRDHGKIRAIPV